MATKVAKKFSTKITIIFNSITTMLLQKTKRIVSVLIKLSDNKFNKIKSENILCAINQIESNYLLFVLITLIKLSN